MKVRDIQAAKAYAISTSTPPGSSNRLWFLFSTREILDAVLGLGKLGIFKKGMDLLTHFFHCSVNNNNLKR